MATRQDSTNSARLSWREYFTDPYLKALIDTAISNNQELNITLQEIAISQNEVLARAGRIPALRGPSRWGGRGKSRPLHQSRHHRSQYRHQARPRNARSPAQFLVDLYARWEVDIWHKLRNAKKAAVIRYLSSVEGRNFTITNIVAEIATSYYELLALDNQLSYCAATTSRFRPTPCALSGCRKKRPRLPNWRCSGSRPRYSIPKACSTVFSSGLPKRKTESTFCWAGTPSTSTAQPGTLKRWYPA